MELSIYRGGVWLGKNQVVNIKCTGLVSLLSSFGDCYNSPRGLSPLQGLRQGTLLAGGGPLSI
eukprot:5646262-Amphidinium_carterae.1